MTRILLALFLTFAAAGASAAGLPAQLRDSATVNDDVIRLGDIWENVGDKAATPIANAPQPGKRVMLEARWLAAVAQAYGIDWQPESAFQRVMLDRAGITIDVAAIEARLREALAEQGAPSEGELEISNRSALAITVPADSSTEIAIRQAAWDGRTHRFAADVEVPAGSPNATIVRVSGRIFDTLRLPVLSRAMNRGDVIRASDIDWVEVRDTAIRAGTVMDADELIGQEPRWQIRAGSPIRSADVQRPILVKRNAMVTLILSAPGMRLTAQGKALEDGGKGDVVRIMNLQSKRTVEGRVEGPDTITVSLGGPIALAN